MQSLIINGSSVIDNHLKLILSSPLSYRSGVFTAFHQRRSMKYRNIFPSLLFSFLLLRISLTIVTKPEYLTRLPYHSLPLSMSLSQLIPYHLLIVYFLGTISVSSSSFLFRLFSWHFPKIVDIKVGKASIFLSRGVPTHIVTSMVWPS